MIVFNARCIKLLLVTAVTLSSVTDAKKAGSALDTSSCVPIDDLGTESLDAFDYSVKLDVTPEEDGSGTCDYEVTINFKHDASLPLPESANDCDPSIQPPSIASDGLPYFAFRWAYESVSKKIKKVTGIDHISIDFNPCGHPPLGVFTVPHYDLHIYTVGPKYRTCMTCNTAAGTPTCDPDNQDSIAGRGTYYHFARGGKEENLLIYRTYY